MTWLPLVRCTAVLRTFTAGGAGAPPEALATAAPCRAPATHGAARLAPLPPLCARRGAVQGWRRAAARRGWRQIVSAEGAARNATAPGVRAGAGTLRSRAPLFGQVSSVERGRTPGNEQNDGQRGRRQPQRHDDVRFVHLRQLLCEVICGDTRAWGLARGSTPHTTHYCLARATLHTRALDLITRARQATHQRTGVPCSCVCVQGVRATRAGTGLGSEVSRVRQGVARCENSSGGDRTAAPRLRLLSGRAGPLGPGYTSQCAPGAAPLSPGCGRHRCGNGVIATTGQTRAPHTLWQSPFDARHTI